MNITSPTLLIDMAKCKSNINSMAQKTARHHLAFRPHFKTHQSAEIAGVLREAGVTKCTVSSVKMANYFADHGWGDILIAFPANVLEYENYNNLAQNISLQLLVYNPEVVDMLNVRLRVPVGIKIELDLGSNRSGMRVDQKAGIEELLQKIDKAEKLNFTGFYSHPGHTYTARSRQEVQDIYHKVVSQLDILKADFGSVPGFSITIGDTPGCTLVDDFGPIREISPGNFVFYDVMQVNIGSCSYDDIAVVMACPVVGKNTERNELLIHGGAVHFSKEALQDADGTFHFGKLAQPLERGWEGHIPGCYLKSISQEHGLVHVTDEVLQNTRPGDVMYVYPAHSCLAADLMRSYLTTDGDHYRF